MAWNWEVVEKLVSGMFSFSWDLVGVIMALAVMYMFIKIHRSDAYDKVNYLDLIMDQETGRLSDSKFRLNIAFALTSFVLIYLTLNNKLTEWYVTGFLGAWVIDRWGARNSTAAIVRNQRDVFRDKLQDEGLYEPTLEAAMTQKPPPYPRTKAAQTLNRNSNDNATHAGRSKQNGNDSEGDEGVGEG